MKGFFDRIKDILYDGTEYILMIAIIAVVALVINWRLGGLFAENVNNTDKPLSTDNTSIVEEYNEFIEDNEENSEVEESEDIDENTEAEIIEIIIPSGSVANEIGNMLVSKGLIEDSSEFVNKVIEMSVETKLKSGTFQITTGSSLEEIINILTK